MAARNPFASSDIYDPYAMIQSSRPARLSTGYYVVRNLLLVGAVAGGLVALYRNDVFRELARRAGQEPRYLAVEQSLVGTPGWGTPRSMEPVLGGSTGAATATTEAAAAPVATESPTVAEMPAAVAATPPAPEPPAAATAVVPATREPVSPVVAAAPVQAPAPPPAAAPPSPPPAAAPPAPPPKPIDPLAPVSLDSLPVLTKAGTLSKPVSFDALPASHAAAPAPLARAAAPAPAARPAPVEHGKAKAVRVSLDETPHGGRSIPAPARAAAPPPSPPPEPPPVAHKPEPPKLKTTDAHKNDNPLMAAVRSAVKARPPKE
jgi:hypothetical protein